MEAFLGVGLDPLGGDIELVGSLALLVLVPIVGRSAYCVEINRESLLWSLQTALLSSARVGVLALSHCVSDQQSLALPAESRRVLFLFTLARRMVKGGVLMLVDYVGVDQLFPPLLERLLRFVPQESGLASHHR